MNKQSALVFAILAGIFAFGQANGQEFTLQSDELQGQLTMNQVYAGFGCSGKNSSPALRWVDAPKNSRSFAITVYDPDAPTGSGWWHWLMVNIPADTRSLATDAGNLSKKLAPEGSLQSLTDFGTPGFGGACPPVGDRPHRYIFTVYALDIAKLAVTEQSPPALVGFMLNQHALAKASLLAYFGR